jgi:hypothetical protein
VILTSLKKKWLISLLYVIQMVINKLPSVNYTIVKLCMKMKLEPLIVNTSLFPFVIVTQLTQNLQVVEDLVTKFILKSKNSLCIGMSTVPVISLLKILMLPSKPMLKISEISSLYVPKPLMDLSLDVIF